MRRPSRQGPIPVCTPGAVTTTADNNSHEKPVTFDTLLASVYCLVMLFFTALVCDAQSIKKEAQDYFDEVREGRYPKVPPAFLTGAERFNVLLPFLNDSSNAVRARAYGLYCSLSFTWPDTSMRKGSVAIILAACKDRDSGIRAMAADFLRQFDRMDFNDAAKDSLSKLIRSKTSPLDRLVKLAGFLDLIHLAPDIRSLSHPGSPSHLRWAALQSLARMGQTDAIDDIMRRVTRLPVTDEMVYEIFPDLIFTRQRVPVAYVVKALLSDEKNCRSADIEREVAIPCGYRIMEQLAPVIEGFPLTLDDTGDLETDNYPEALETARRWFNTNHDYVIKNNRY